jgi:hypothetical protein
VFHSEGAQGGVDLCTKFSLFSWDKNTENSIGTSAEVPNFQSRLHKKDGDKPGKQGRIKSSSKQVVKVTTQRTLTESCNIMKRLSLVLVGVGCMLFQSAQATLLYSEAFNYNTGALGGNVNPFTSTAWSSGSANLTVVSGNLTYPGLLDQGGNELQIINGVSAGSIYDTFANQTSGQIYYSFLFDPTAADSANNYFTAMNPGTTAPGGSTDAIDAYFYSGGKIEVRAAAQSASAGTGTALTLNTTYLIVEEIDLDAKTASLWIDPTPGAAAPTATATLSGITATAVDNVGFKAQATAGGPYLVDNLLIGTTWADVTPTPEPTTCALAGLGLLGLVLARRMRK